jgi:hypothetical protein
VALGGVPELPWRTRTDRRQKSRPCLHPCPPRWTTQLDLWALAGPGGSWPATVVQVRPERARWKQRGPEVLDDVVDVWRFSVSPPLSHVASDFLLIATSWKKMDPRIAVQLSLETWPVL